jgi:hypothetical protein
MQYYVKTTITKILYFIKMHVRTSTLLYSDEVINIIEDRTIFSGAGSK